jgi:hypothetical protein
LASIGKKIEKLHQLTEERDAHVQAIAALEELVPRMALTATSEDSARAQINYAEQGITECRKKAHELDREIDKVKSDREKGFRMEEGPFIIGLDRVLKGFNVQRLASYSSKGTETSATTAWRGSTGSYRAHSEKPTQSCRRTTPYKAQEDRRRVTATHTH